MPTPCYSIPAFPKNSARTGAVRRLLAGLALFISASVAPMAAASSVQPYVPEPHGGLADILAKGSSTFFKADFSPPALQWPQAGDRGRVPAGWKDLTTSPEAKGSFARIVFDGVPMFSLEASRASAGVGAFRAGISLGRPQPGILYRIKLHTRSTTRTPLIASIIGDGGEVLWSQPVSPGTGWARSELVWVAPADRAASARSGEVSLSFGLERPGSCDVIGLTVETINREQLQAMLTDSSSVHADGLRNTRFPLGLPTRWLIDRATSDDERPVTADPAVPGPSGIPSLHVSAPPERAADQAKAGAIILYGEPFSLARFWQPHLAAFSVRGDAKITLDVRSGFNTLATQTFEVTGNEGWKRVGLPFTPRLLDEYYLQIRIDGEAWLDAFRVAPGGADEPAALAYVPPGVVEVSLASPSPARVLFSDDPADAPGRRVEWAALSPADGFPAGSVLRAKVVNLYDQQIRLPDVPLNGPGPVARGHWIMPEFPGKPFGAHRVEAWVVDAEGKRLSPFDELVVYRLPRPRYWGHDAENSAFGVHVNSTRRLLESVKAIGVNWVRLHDAGINYIGWHFLEKERGRWTWEDDAIRRYRDHHLMILGQLGTAPAWATALQRVGPGGWLDRYYRPEDWDGWNNYVSTITKRYQTQIRYWDVWNEPWLISFWKADSKVDAEGRLTYLWGENPPAAYARLTREAATSAHAVDPGLKIVGLNTTTGESTVPNRRYSGADWTRLVSEADGFRGASALSYHLYITREIGYEQDWVEASYKRAVGSLIDPATGRPPLPVWMTEGSAVQFATGRGFYYQSLPTPGESEDKGLAVSDQLVRYLTTTLATGTEKIFLYSLHKYGFFDDGSPFRALLSEDGQLHPSAVAHASLALRIDGRRFVKALQITPETRAYVFADGTDEKNGGWTAVLIPKTFETPSTVSLKKIGSLQADDIFGNPLAPAAGTPKGAFFVSGTKAFDDSALNALKPAAR